MNCGILLDKVIIMGLAQSGKTTIVKVTAEGMIPQKKADYTATLDYKRNTYDLFGTKVSMFDLGGQKSFLDRFIGELAEFVFTNVSALIFVLDVSNMDTISLAKYYYDMGKKTLKKYSPEAETKVLLHKMDLIDSTKKDDFIISVKEFLEFEKDDTIFETNVFDKSIFKAMEKIIRGLNKEPENVAFFIKNFQKENADSLEYISVRDKDNNEITKFGMTNSDSIQFYNYIQADHLKTITFNDPLLYSFNQFGSKLIFVARLNNNLSVIIVFAQKELEFLDNQYIKLLNNSIKLKSDLNNVKYD